MERKGKMDSSEVTESRAVIPVTVYVPSADAADLLWGHVTPRHFKYMSPEDRAAILADVIWQRAVAGSLEKPTKQELQATLESAYPEAPPISYDGPVEVGPVPSVFRTTGELPPADEKMQPMEPISKGKSR
jgi:hypothetical protein